MIPSHFLQLGLGLRQVGSKGGCPKVLYPAVAFVAVNKLPLVALVANRVKPLESHPLLEKLTVSAIPINIPEAEEQRVKLLSDAIAGRKSAVLVISESSYEVPESICRLFEALLKMTQETSSLSVIPDLQELTTQEAANLLNVSRQYLVRLLDDEKIPYHKVGSHRRIYSRDLLTYRRKQKSPRKLGLGELPQYSFDWK